MTLSDVSFANISSLIRLSRWYMGKKIMISIIWGFPGGASGKEPTCLHRSKRCWCDLGSGRFRGGAHGTPLQYSCLGNPMDRGSWQATIHGIPRVRHNLATKPPHSKFCLFIYLSVDIWIASIFWLLWIMFQAGLNYGCIVWLSSYDSFLMRIVYASYLSTSTDIHMELTWS